LGEEEARRAGEKLKDYKFEIAYTSMLIRAKSLRIILTRANRNTSGEK
jgi:bisphosphoglycerate-dependent phosphoglycerate mutase